MISIKHRSEEFHAHSNHKKINDTKKSANLFYYEIFVTKMGFLRRLKE